MIMFQPPQLVCASGLNHPPRAAAARAERERGGGAARSRGGRGSPNRLEGAERAAWRVLLSFDCEHLTDRGCLLLLLRESLAVDPRRTAGEINEAAVGR